MRIYTKEWYSLERQLGMAEMFEPVIDKEYSDEEFEQLYQDAKDTYIQEEHDSYDEPPILMFDEDEDDEDDDDAFDPEDYLIGDIGEDGEEYDLRHPSSPEELREYQKKELEFLLDEYENREPFDEEEAAEEFDEDYRDNLEHPDEDVPAWIRETVDPRLIAIWRLPEKVYRKLVAEEKEMQERFDVLDSAADEALEEMLDAVPEEFEELAEDLDDLDGEYVTSISISGSDAEIRLSGWDEEGEACEITLDFEDAELLEDDGAKIEVTCDEDGDVESSCDLAYHEVYFEDGRIEMHMLLDDGEPKYLTIRCSDIHITGKHS